MPAINKDISSSKVEWSNEENDALIINKNKINTDNDMIMLLAQGKTSWCSCNDKLWNFVENSTQEGKLSTKCSQHEAESSHMIEYNQLRGFINDRWGIN